MSCFIVTVFLTVCCGLLLTKIKATWMKFLTLCELQSNHEMLCDWLLKY